MLNGIALMPSQVHRYCQTGIIWDLPDYAEIGAGSAFPPEARVESDGYQILPVQAVDKDLSTHKIAGLSVERVVHSMG